MLSYKRKKIKEIHIAILGGMRQEALNGPLSQTERTGDFMNEHKQAKHKQTHKQSQQQKQYKQHNKSNTTKTTQTVKLHKQQKQHKA